MGSGAIASAGSEGTATGVGCAGAAGAWCRSHFPPDKSPNLDILNTYYYLEIFIMQ